MMKHLCGSRSLPMHESGCSGPVDPLYSVVLCNANSVHLPTLTLDLPWRRTTDITNNITISIITIVRHTMIIAVIATNIAIVAVIVIVTVLISAQACSGCVCVAVLFIRPIATPAPRASQPAATTLSSCLRRRRTKSPIGVTPTSRRSEMNCHRY